MKVTLTDPVRVESPMAKLRQQLPHTLVLEFDPDVGDDSAVSPNAIPKAAQPGEIMARFFEHVTGTPPDDEAQRLIASSVEATQREEAR